MIGAKMSQMLLDSTSLKFYQYEGDMQEHLDKVRKVCGHCVVNLCAPQLISNSICSTKGCVNSVWLMRAKAPESTTGTHAGPLQQCAHKTRRRA